METMTKMLAPIGDNNPPTDAEMLHKALETKHEKLLGGAARLLGAADRLPAVIEDDETAGKASDYIKLVMGCVKNLEAERVNEKEPYLTLGRLVDGFFKTTTEALAGAKVKAQRPLDAYLKEKAMAEQRRRNEEAARLRAESEAQAAAAQALEKANMKPQAEAVLDQAVIAAQQAAKAEKHADAKPAEMSQSRSASGAVASLRTRWVGELVSIEALELDIIRHHIAPEALQKAINSYVAAGGRVLKGANIFEKSETVVR